MDRKKKLAVVAAQEQELRFDHFTYEDACELGLMMVQEAKERKVAIAIDIVVNGYQVFRYSFPGTCQFNTVWIGRKHKVVNLMQKSSLRVYYELQDWGEDLSRDQHFDGSEYGDRGGGFPIYVRGVGMIGSVAVSGLSHIGDHNVAVAGIARYLGASAQAIDEE